MIALVCDEEDYVKSVRTPASFLQQPHTREMNEEVEFTNKVLNKGLMFIIYLLIVTPLIVVLSQCSLSVQTVIELITYIHTYLAYHSMVLGETTQLLKAIYPVNHQLRNKSDIESIQIPWSRQQKRPSGV